VSVRIPQWTTNTWRHVRNAALATLALLLLAFAFPGVVVPMLAVGIMAIAAMMFTEQPRAPSRRVRRAKAAAITIPHMADDPLPAQIVGMAYAALLLTGRLKRLSPGSLAAADMN